MIGATSVLLLAAAGLLQAECPVPGLLQGGDDLVYPDSFETFACSAIAGLSCDGADSDRCREGAIACTSEIPSCSDNTGSTVDLCNLLDDDCDPVSGDGSEDPQSGLACDGPDGDLCLEGANQCGGGVLSCNDATGTTFDVCNGLDDDCDPGSVDGAEDPSLGLACDGADGDLCAEGALFCATATLQCNDFSGTNVELCNGLDDDCDLAIDEDFIRDNNPVCATTTTFLGAIAGDSGSPPPQIVQSGNNEQWHRVRLSEQDSGIPGIELLGRVTLVPGPGTDFDLFVYCLSCGGTLIGSSTNGGQASDTVSVRNPEDILGTDDSFDIVIEVRHFSSNRCASWSLTVQGNTAGQLPGTCDP